jgi:SPFH domain/Band 7 family protein
MKLFKTRSKLALGCLTAFIVGAAGWSYYRMNLQWIPAGYVGIKFNARSGADRSRLYEPQAYFTGPFEQFYLYPTRIQNAVYTQDPTAGESKSADGILITTNDTANTTFDVSVIYRIDKKDVFLAFDTFGPIPIETIQSQHIRRAVREESSVVGNQYDVYSLMGPKRVEASEMLSERLRAKLAPKGITIIQAMILNAYPSQDLVTKIHNNVNSVTGVQIATLNQQIATMQNQINVVNAQATQEAQKITGAGTGAKSLDIIDLELAEEAAKRWNGEFSKIEGGGSKSIIVNGSNILGQSKR